MDGEHCGDNTFFCPWERESSKNGNFILDFNIEIVSQRSAALVQCCRGYQYFHFKWHFETGHSNICLMLALGKQYFSVCILLSDNVQSPVNFQGKLLI